MNILFLTRLFYPHIGGVEKHVLEVGKRLVKDGHNVTVITENHGYKGTETIEGMQIVRIPVGKSEKLKKFAIWSWLQKNKYLIDEADIVHCHDVFFWYLPFKALLPKKPVYIKFHGYETVFPPQMSAKINRKLAENLTLGNICVGDFIAPWYETKPTFVTYGGVEIEKIKLKTKHKTPRIVFIGRGTKDNGIHVYLQALEIFKEHKINFTFEVYGDTPYKKEIETFGKVYGFVEDIQAVLAQSTLVFASSYLSIFDAFAQKKPVFAVYTNPLKRDYLEMSPFAKFITMTDNPHTLAQEIKKTIENTMYKIDNITHEYEWVQNQTWDKVKELYSALWKIE
ncbi:MAG TPA: glycosyltransferase family 4 protein [Patescibacteria group bacterium]